MPDGPCPSCNASWLRSEDQDGNQEIGHEPGCPGLAPAQCRTTHHACDCQIEWRREAEALLRDIVRRAALYRWAYASTSVRRARLLLGEETNGG